FSGSDNIVESVESVEDRPQELVLPADPEIVSAPEVQTPELGEMIEIGVFAKGGNLRPIRIRVDRDLRRPYWIDRDSIRTFEFKDQIVIEENIDLIALSVGGFDYPLGLNPGNRVIISRDKVKSFYESIASR
ncbi:MAG: hypothetical protein HKN13_06560, partial [Rhodothermales bacterium]|nr:hypothetical protein [Rhodothermales bacterium]